MASHGTAQPSARDSQGERASETLRNGFSPAAAHPDSTGRSSSGGQRVDRIGERVPQKHSLLRDRLAHRAKRGTGTLRARLAAIPVPAIKDALAALGVAGAYYLGARLAFYVGTFSYLFAPLWPPNMILLCALLRAPFRMWWIYIAAALPAHIAAETEMGMPALEWLGAFSCNCALATGAAFGLRRFAGQPPWLSSLETAWIFILVVAFGAPTAVAAAVAALAWLTGGTVGTLEFAARWGLANVAGGLTLAPMLVTWFAGGFGWVADFPRGRAAEALLLTAVLGVSVYFAFGFASLDMRFPGLIGLFVPPLLWASVRFGTQGATGAIFVVTFMAIDGAMRGHSPFNSASPEETVLSLQIFMAAASAPFLLLAPALEERRRAMAAVKLEEQKLQSILDHTPAGIFARDLAERYILMNRTLLSWFEASPEDLGKTPGELFPKDVAQALTADDEQAIQNRDPTTREIELDLPAGRRVLLSTKFALRNDRGEIYGICGIATDITERRRSLEALQASEARFRIMAETVPAILFTADRDGHLEYASARFHDITGVSHKSIVGPISAQVLHRDDIVRAQTAWRRSIAHGEPFEEELRLRSPDGTFYWFAARCRPIRNSDGQIERWFGVALEIDEQKRIEDELRRANARLSAILSGISDFYYTLDNKLRVTAMNPQAAQFIGTTVDETVGRSVFDVVPPLRGSKIEAAYRRALNARTTVHIEVPSVLYPALWLDINIYPCDDGLSVFSRDVTERKRTQEALHELSGRLLRSQDEERHRIARELHDGTAQNMSAVLLNLHRLEQLLGVAHAGAGRLIEESSTLLNDCLKEIRTLSYLLHPPLLDEVGLSSALPWYVKGFMERSTISVSLKIAPDLGRLPPEVEMALFRVVQESLGNVHRHSGSKSAAIALRRTARGVVLTISDKGRGMSREITTNWDDEIRSLGVGVAGMRARLKQLGGHLEIASSRNGTTVRAIFPQAPV